MTTMDEQGVSFEVRYADGRRDDIQVTHRCIVLGGASHCDVRILADGVAREHVVVTRSGRDVVLYPRSTSPAALLDGRPLTQTQSIREGLLQIGGVSIRVRSLAPAAPRRTGIVCARSLRVAVLGVGLVAGLAMVGLGPSGKDASPKAPAPAKLWDEERASCSDLAHEPERARSAAAEKEKLAVAKRERRAFRVQEGVSAVSLFEQSAACSEVAGDREPTVAQRAAAKALRAKIEEEYHAHQVRLEHASSIGDDAAMALELGVLLDLTEGRDDAYVEWLRALRRRTDLKLAAAAETNHGRSSL